MRFKILGLKSLYRQIVNAHQSDAVCDQAAGSLYRDVAVAWIELGALIVPKTGVTRFEENTLGLIWEAGRLYAYLRTTPDRRVMIGGGDEDFLSPELRDALIGKKARHLEKLLREMLPEIKTEPDFQWGGTFGDTRDG